MDGPLIIGFRGADSYFAPPNLGNVKLNEIGARIGAVMFDSLNVSGAFRFLLRQLDLDGDGIYDPRKGDVRRDVRIFGHSWGAVSAVKLAARIGQSQQFHDKQIEVLAALDPVTLMRRPPIQVGPNVNRFWNRYQSSGQLPIVCGPIPMFGEPLTTAACVACDQRDLNPAPGDLITKRPVPRTRRPVAYINHWWILWEVEDELVELMGDRQPVAQLSRV